MRGCPYDRKTACIGRYCPCRITQLWCYGFVMIRAVLFDVYGTIAGWTPSRYQLQKQACAAFELGKAVTPEGILKGYASADAFMTAENASRPLRLRDQKGRDDFFAEYERLVLQGCGIDVSARSCPGDFQPSQRRALGTNAVRGCGPNLDCAERAWDDPGSHF